MSNLNSVKTEIKIDGKSCDFIKLDLKQSMTNHHEFEITVNYRHNKPCVWTETPDVIFAQLGKPVFIKMTHIASGDVNEFLGVVTDIDILGKDGDQGKVLLRGGSPTVLLDRDPAMGSFRDYTLHNVVGEILDNSGVRIDVQNKPKFAGQIPYLARYKESSYAFLARVLSSYNEWFYYDGTKLIVGNPQNIETRTVYYDMELSGVTITSGIHNLNVEIYDYDPSRNDYMEDGPPENIDGVVPLMRQARGISDPLYPTPAKLPANRAIYSEDDIVRNMRAHHSRNYSKMLRFEGKSKTCGIKIGGLVTAIIPPSFTKVKHKDMGRFRVIEVHHIAGMNDEYENTYKGVVGLTEALPADKIVMPIALPEPATVVDNNDPKKQGRVKVRYFWQSSRDSMATTNWIRVQQPDAGKSGNVPTNRGFWFIPEIDDQVMVGFQQGDPSRPYVMGSLFHRDNTRGAAKENTIKSIVTRSGHSIELNDNEKDGWGITIRDRQGNVIQMDTLGKNITITAPETISLHAKNINIQANENMFLFSGKDTRQSVGKNCSINVTGTYKSAIEETMDVSVRGKSTVTMENDLKHDITGTIKQTAETVNITAEKGTANIKSKDKLTLKSVTDDVIIAQ